MQTNPRIIIADDHPIFRAGLVRTIEQHNTFSIIGEASDGAEALHLIRTLHPDIALLDVEMPKMNGIDVAKSLHADAFVTDVVILTMYKDPAYFNTALDFGVRGFLLKDSVITELTRCLTVVSSGEYYISPSLSHLLIAREKRNTSLLQNVPAIQLLTPAERKILLLLADNLTSKEIADRMFVSIRTVENHRLHMVQKLGLKGHNKLLQFALEHRSEL